MIEAIETPWENPYYHPLPPSVEALLVYAEDLEDEANWITWEWANTEIKSHILGYVRAGLVAAQVRYRKLYQKGKQKFEQISITLEVKQQILEKASRAGISPQELLERAIENYEVESTPPDVIEEVSAEKVEVWQADLKAIAGELSGPEKISPLELETLDNNFIEEEKGLPAHRLLLMQAEWQIGGKWRETLIEAIDRHPEWGIEVTSSGVRRKR